MYVILKKRGTQKEQVEGKKKEGKEKEKKREEKRNIDGTLAVQMPGYGVILG